MILIVDDEKMIADSLVKYFRRKEFDVTVAYNVQEAKTLLDNGLNPSILITDMIMPDGTGLDLVKKIKSQNTNCLFFIVTGFSNETEDEIRDSGVTEVFQKPFDRKEILEKIQQYIKS